MLKKRIRTFRALACLLLVAVIAVSPLGGRQIGAAAKASLQTKSAKIGVNEKTTIVLKNKVGSAKYAFTSKNSNIANVSSKGRVIGKAPGTTKIVVEQNAKGKVAKVGEFKVVVAGSKLNTKKTELFVDETVSYKEFLDYYNSKAKYKLSSSKTSVVKVSATGTIKAVEEGTATVTVKETFNGKSRTVGKITITVSEDEDYYEDDDEYYEDEEDEYYEDDGDGEYYEEEE